MDVITRAGWCNRALAALGLACAFGLSACAATQTPLAADEAARVNPESWPRGRSGARRDAAIEARVAELLARMSVEEKVGQIIQADLASVTPEDVRRYRLGSILNGGSSGPDGDDRAAAAVWLAAADAFYDASMDAPEGRPAIPLLWGSDAVHGNSNIIGATIFPHNIGLGAARNPALMRRIGEITALELRVIGQDWTFAPTIAVVRDDRWGRTYEGYSEDPAIVRQYAPAIVEGIQGRPGDADFLRGPHVIATAKHFLGDGGTHNGRDQGDNRASERELREIFAPGYYTAIGAGVQTVMASYNSWHGQKMHGYGEMLTDVLVGRIGFDGFVIGDWNGHGQVVGCSNDNCAAAINAGVDMVMAPDGWRGLYENTLAQVRSGEIPMARLDEAVSRILRVKLRAGLFEAGRPSSRAYAGQWELLGAAEHRAVARQAVRESLVLLKNERALLPLSPRARVLVAGAGADDMGRQTGGWTISWQGTDNSREDFPNGQTIFEGVREAVEAAGGSAVLSVDGAYTERPDVAIVVFGETPYAEFSGDVPHLDYEPEGDLELMRRLRAEGVPVVAVFLSGRPLYVTPEINTSNAFVAAWLPGTEGGGLADVLFRRADGSIAHDFRGRLSFSWPRAPDQTPLNVGDADYDPLFAYGYGLRYARPATVGPLPEAAVAPIAARNVASYLRLGRLSAPWTLSEAGMSTQSGRNRLHAAWSGETAGTLSLTGGAVDITREANGGMSLIVSLYVEEAPTAPVTLAMGCGEGCGGALDITERLRTAGDGVTSVAVRLSCFIDAGADMTRISTPVRISTPGRLGLALVTARVAESEGLAGCPPRAR